jgi:hypothetical protein
MIARHVGFSSTHVLIRPDKKISEMAAESKSTVAATTTAITATNAGTACSPAVDVDVHTHCGKELPLLSLGGLRARHATSSLTDGDWSMIEERELKRANGTALERHVTFFADTDGKRLTKEVIVEAHRLLGMGNGKSIQFKADAILQLAQSVKGLCQVLNPAASKLWTPEGNIDEVRWAALIGSRGYVTKSDFVRFVDRVHPPVPTAAVSLAAPAPGSDDVAATVAMGLIKVTWHRITDGSVNELFEYFVDHWVVPADGGGVAEPAISVPTLRLFYERFPVVAIRLLRGKLPVAPPAGARAAAASSGPCTIL